jgi:hypothetical protein
MLFACALHLLIYDMFDLTCNTKELIEKYVSARTSVEQEVLF